MLMLMLIAEENFAPQLSQVLIEGTTPDEICMPGTTVMNMHTRIRSYAHKYKYTNYHHYTQYILFSILT